MTSSTKEKLFSKRYFSISDFKTYIINLFYEKTIKDLTSKKLKNETRNNILFTSLGGVLGIIASIVAVVLTSVMQSEGKEERKQLNKQTYDMRVEQNHLQTDLQQMRSEITSLQNEIDSLKNSSD